MDRKIHMPTGLSDLIGQVGQGVIALNKSQAAAENNPPNTAEDEYAELLADKNRMRSFIKEESGWRESYCIIYNASNENLELVAQSVRHGEIRQGITRPSIKPGQYAAWTGTKRWLALYGC